MTAVVRAALGRLRPPGAHNRGGRSYAVVSLTPIRAQQEQALRTHLAGLTVSPFAELVDVQLARWLVLDQLKSAWPGAPRRRTRLRSQYLLFTASVTAPDDASARTLPGSFLRRIAERIPDAADAVWGHCVNYPGAGSADAFVDYLGRSLLDSLLFYAGYDATADQVRTALARRASLMRFVRAHQGVTDPAVLHQRYVAEAATW